MTSPWIEGDALTDKLADGYDYDAIGRMTAHLEPWGRKTTYKYAGNVASATDWLGTTKREVDAVGRVVKTTDKAGGTVETKYGPFSLPHTVTRLGNETTTTVRDAYGRVLEEHDPDRGTTTTRYDGFGEVVALDDAAARHFALAYDGIGRLVQRDDTVSGETRTTNWDYDTAPHGIGRIAEVTSPDGHVDAYTYTKRSQPETHTLTLADTGERFSSALSYDSLGRVSVVTYPKPSGVDALAVRQEHDAFGNVVSLRDDATGAPFWTLAQRDGAGRPNEEVLGNGVVVKHQYEHDSGVVKRIQATLQAKGKSGQLQDLRYEHDQGLRMTSRTDALQTGPLGHLEEGFGYDAIDRLTCMRPSALQPPRSLCASPIHYAPNGNIEKKDGLAYAYDPAHPHAVQAVGADSYDNDAVGNQTERPGLTIGYTPFDLPESYTFDAYGNGPSPGDVRIQYDGDQHRIRKTVLNADGFASQETVYLDELYERVRSGDDTHRFYIAAGSAMVVLTRAAGAPDQIAYALTDALGSVDKITSGTGGVIEQRSYDAFGARRNPAGWGPWQGPLASGVTPVGFEGLEADDEAGLVNMRGRIYDPKLGRFLSTDPLVSRPGFAQSWNPYSYVLNSPLNLADPSGFDPVMTAAGTDGVIYGTGPALHVSAGENLQMVLKQEHGIGAAPAEAKDAGRDDTPGKQAPPSNDATWRGRGPDPWPPMTQERALALLEGPRPPPKPDASKLTGGQRILADVVVTLCGTFGCTRVGGPPSTDLERYLSQAIARQENDAKLRPIAAAPMVGVPGGAASQLAAEGETALSVAVADVFAEHRVLTADLGLGPKSTLAKLEAGGQTFWGVNAHGQPLALKVNAISATHAEADAFNQAMKAGVRGGEARLVVNRALCPACGTNGAVRSMARQLGLELVEVVTPNGVSVIKP